jgi:hypothetical protein
MRYQAGIILPGYNPLLVANAPTIGTATGGNVSASVTFTAPADTGGAAITGYTVVSTPGGVIGTGASSPITVSGLTNGTAYTFKVFATNAYGPSPLSAASNSVTPALAIGDAFGGGFFAGQIGVAGVATHNLVVGPVASAQNTSIQYKNANTSVPGADSVIDGPQNTADMVADGNSTVYPAAHFCNNLVIGGFSDWYMPAKNELEVCYYNLKPTTTSNNTSSGTNTNAVPSRGSNYTSGTPARTSAAAFQSGGSEAYVAEHEYWSSTENTATTAWYQYFTNGNQANDTKTGSNRVRAIRRVAV